MDEALQIVAHTWSKFQSPLLHQNEELTKELDHAKITIHHLHQQVHHMQNDMNNQSTTHDDQKMLIEACQLLDSICTSGGHYSYKDTKDM